MNSEAQELVGVIDGMLAFVPAGDVLVGRLESCRSSAAYMSPETVGLRWRVTFEVLRDRFGGESDLGGWAEDVLNVWVKGVGGGDE